MRTKLLVSVAILVSTGALAGAVMWRRNVSRQASTPTVQAQVIVAPSKGSLAGQKLPSAQTSAQFPGGIEITLQGEAEMLLTDPSGRRTGFDAHSNSSVAEIPDASAGDDSIDDPNDNSDSPINIQAKKLEISPAVNGTYTLTVTSATTGAYDLDLAALSPTYQGANVELKGIQIVAGARHIYLFKGDIANGGSLRVSGGFGGNSDAADHGNRLLTYASPVSSETNVSAEIRTFSLVVFYDPRSRPDGFSAALDGQQVTGMFHPTPGGFEKVDIPLHPGRNVLVLTIAGSLSDSVSVDRDSFTFIVPIWNK